MNWFTRLRASRLRSRSPRISKVKGRNLWHIKYPLANGVTYQFPVAFDEVGKPTGFETRDYIVVATTRPETMLGDTADAVHPDDAL